MAASIPDDSAVALAKRFGVSREAAVRRLTVLERVSLDYYRRKRNQLLHEHEARVKPEKPGFAPPPALAIARSGPQFTRLVLAAFDEERITASDVSRFLGMQLKHLDKVRRSIQKPSGGGGRHMSYSMDTSRLDGSVGARLPARRVPHALDNIDDLIRKQKVKCVDEVLRELEEKQDDLCAWCKKRRKKMFVSLGKNPQIQRRAKGIVNQFPSLIDPSDTHGQADPFVIALAAEWDWTVVTAERSKPSKPKIPDACRDLGIPCITLVEMFQQEGWTF